MKLKKLSIILGVLAFVCVPFTFAFAGEWRSLDPLDEGRSQLQAAAIGGEIFAAGGSSLLGPRNAFEVYDVEYDYWRSLPSMPQSAEQFAMVATGGEIYLIGGFGEDGRDAPLVKVQVFVPTISSWRNGTDMLSPRARHGAVAVDGKVYVLGGISDDGELTPEVAMFDIGNNRWSADVAHLPVPRSDLSVVAHDGLIYAIGGRGASGTPTARVDIYDPVANTWSRGPDLPAPRAAHVSGVINSQIHISGGSGSGQFETLQDHYVYAPEAGGGWQRAEDLPSPRHSLASVVVDGLWYLLGGGAGAGVFAEFTETDVLEVYDPAVN